MLDRLAVAVPAGHVGSAETAHRLVAVDDVLRNLVLRVAKMNGAVRVRGAVVQDEGHSVLVLLLQLLVYVILFPLREALGLVFREIAPHREVGSRQVHRFLVIARHKSGPAFPDRFLCKAHECAIRQTIRLYLFSFRNSIKLMTCTYYSNSPRNCTKNRDLGNGKVTLFQCLSVRD